jgi:hypothetical protein
VEKVNNNVKKEELGWVFQIMKNNGEHVVEEEFAL